MLYFLKFWSLLLLKIIVKIFYQLHNQGTTQIGLVI